MNCNQNKKTCNSHIPYKPGEPGFCAKENFRCIDDLKTMLPRLSHSARQQFTHCRKAYYYSQILGIRTRSHRLTIPIKAGAIWDTFLDLKYNKAKNIKEKIISEMDTYDAPEDLRAKLFALMRGFKDLNINTDTNFIESQHEVIYNLNNNIIIGYADRLHKDFIVESKLSSRPDFYKNTFHMASQLSTYFLALPDLEKAVVEITRLPTLRLKNQNKSNQESIKDFEARIYSDIIKRPSNYFIGWNRMKRSFGIPMYRADFNIEKMLNIYLSVNEDIKKCVEANSPDVWWENYLSCNSPTQCLYYKICTSGVVNDSVYERRWEK